MASEDAYQQASMETLPYSMPKRAATFGASVLSDKPHHSIPQLWTGLGLPEQWRGGTAQPATPHDSAALPPRPPQPPPPPKCRDGKGNSDKRFLMGTARGGRSETLRGGANLLRGMGYRQKNTWPTMRIKWPARPVGA
jgi:hypothetical protein